MEQTKGQINEVLGLALHAAGKIAGKVAGRTILGAKKGISSAKRDIQKAKNRDTDNDLKKKARNKLDSIGKKKLDKKKAKSVKKSLKTKSKKADLKASIKASKDVIKKREKDKKAKAAETVTEMKKGNLDQIDSFEAVYITEGAKKTARQFKGTAKEFKNEKDPKKKTDKLKRMVKLAKKNKKQKESHENRKAHRDVTRQAAAEENDE